MEKLLAVTAIGADRAGLVRDLSRCITTAGGNILESRMATLGSEFAVLMLVAGNWHAINKVSETLEELGQNSGMTVNVRPTEAGGADEPAAPYNVDVIALDQEGIVAGLSGFFSSRNLTITDPTTRLYNAPHTGSAMFSVQMVISIPRSIHLAGLREEFHEYCESENLDAVIEPAQR